MRIGIGDIGALRNEGEILSSGVGSCVVIILYDSKTKVGGMAHILLPNRKYSKSSEDINRFPEPAINNLLAEMENLGAQRARIYARLVGGASMFESDRTEPMGEKNINACRQLLEKLSIPITGEDTGGNWGRSLVFNVDTGKVKITTYKIGKKEL